MNTKRLLISLSIITLASCSTAYKTGQTPDDVYYSPVRSYGEEKRDEKQDERRDEAYYNFEERQIRMGTYDRRWRDFDNDISYNPYKYGYNYGYYYNPFYAAYPVYNSCNCVCVTSNPKTTTPRMANLGGYGTGYINSNTSNVLTKYGTTAGPVKPAPVRNYNNSNKGSKLANTLNKIFNNSSSSSSNNSTDNNSNSSSNSRTYSPSSSSSRSSSSGSVSRPARSGKN